MRSVFDQYSEPENRLTHALAICLHEDKVFLRAFVKWLGAQVPARVRRLMIEEQSLPGEAPATEDEAERRGLPDIVIHDGSTWCLFIESKVRARLTEDQLRRQTYTLRRRGFQRINCLVLTRADAGAPRAAVARTWSQLYQWIGEGGDRNGWPRRLRSYLRDAEARLVQEEYLTEGTLTVFDGFPFSSDNPYTYLEAKRLLKLALRELRNDRSLRALGMDPNGRGRGAITGRHDSAVWDFLPLADRPKSRTFTNYPHMTLDVHADRVGVAITIPNDVIGSVRRRLAALEPEHLVSLNAEILRRAKRILSRGGWIEAYAEQRHFLRQGSTQIRDARLQFKLEASQPKDHGRVKHRSEWVSGFAALLRKKHANIQFGYLVNLPWGTKGLKSRDSLELIAASWTALKPLLDAIRGETKQGGRRR